MTFKQSEILGLLIPLAVVLACFVLLGLFLFRAWKVGDGLKPGAFPHPPVMGGTD